MKKFITILLTLALTFSLAACGGEKEKGSDTSDTGTSTQTENFSSESTETTTHENAETASTEDTTVTEDGSIAAKGETCTVIVPNPETSFTPL